MDKTETQFAFWTAMEMRCKRKLEDRSSPVRFAILLPSSRIKLRLSSAQAPNVSIATGIKKKSLAISTYFKIFFRKAFSAAPPPVALVTSLLLLANFMRRHLNQFLWRWTDQLLLAFLQRRFELSSSFSLSKECPRKMHMTGLSPSFVTALLRRRRPDGGCASSRTEGCQQKILTDRGGHHLPHLTKLSEKCKIF